VSISVAKNLLCFEGEVELINCSISEMAAVNGADGEMMDSSYASAS
jgi:hypothetical protein